MHDHGRFAPGHTTRLIGIFRISSSDTQPAASALAAARVACDIIRVASRAPALPSQVTTSKAVADARVACVARVACAGQYPGAGSGSHSIIRSLACGFDKLTGAASRQRRTFRGLVSAPADAPSRWPDPAISAVLRLMAAIPGADRIILLIFLLLIIIFLIVIVLFLLLDSGR